MQGKGSMAPSSEDQKPSTKLGKLQQLLDELQQLAQAGETREAIHLSETALEVVSKNGEPQLWAWVQFQLGTSFGQAPGGDRSENLETAIEHYNQALLVYTIQDFPEQWAAIQNNLASAYANRIRGDRSENLERAIEYCFRALQLYTIQDSPEQWATAHNNLANAYANRIRGDRSENLERAIEYYNQALVVYTQTQSLESRAMIWSNLANVYANRTRGDHSENLERAIEHYQKALDVYTIQDFPEQWAATQNNLASAYAKRIRDDRSENLGRAIEHYQKALDVYTRRNFPQDCRNTAYALANLFYDENRFAEACKAYTIAHEASEVLRAEIQREEAKRKLAEENALLYARLVHCCLHEHDVDAAFEYAAAGKARALVDLLATGPFDPSDASTNYPRLTEDLRKAEELRKQISNLMTQLTNPGSRLTKSLEEMQAALRTLQDEHDALWEDMSYNYPWLTATQQVPMLSTGEARKLAAEQGATLVEFFEHADGWCAFIVSPGGVHYVALPRVDDELQERMLRWVVRIRSPAGRGRLSYGSLHRLHEALIAPLRDHLSSDTAIFLAPFSWLHLVPLGAALHPTTGHYAAEDFQLAFIPSISALRVVVERAHRRGELVEQPASVTLLVAAYPGAPGSNSYLPNVIPEAEAVASHFARVTSLIGEAATPEAVLEHAHRHDVVHLSCPSWFDSEVPEQSGLMLSGGWLTVQRIIADLRLERTRLLSMSASFGAEVAVRPVDEHVGLLQAMMIAGAQVVVASLWSVDDAASRAFFEAFYAQIEAGRSPAEALSQAARLVRSRPGWEHPYYWANFQVTGVAHEANVVGTKPQPDDVVTHTADS